MRRQPGVEHGLRDDHAHQHLVQGRHVHELVHPGLPRVLPGPPLGRHLVLLVGVGVLDARLQPQDAEAPGVAALHVQQRDGQSVAVHGVDLQFLEQVGVRNKFDVGFPEAPVQAGNGLGGPAEGPRVVPDGGAAVVHDEALALPARQVGREAVHDQLDHLGLERAVRDAAREVLAARDAGGERVPGVELQGGDVPPALGLRHVLGRRDVGVIIKRQDHARHAAREVLGYVPLELALYVVLPGDDPVDPGGHQADLAVDEDGVGREGSVRGEGQGGLLLEAGDPGGVYGHARGQKGGACAEF